MNAYVLVTFGKPTEDETAAVVYVLLDNVTTSRGNTYKDLTEKHSFSNLFIGIDSRCRT